MCSTVTKHTLYHCTHVYTGIGGVHVNILCTTACMVVHAHMGNCVTQLAHVERRCMRKCS